MLALTIAMGTVVWAMILYALLQPNPTDAEATNDDALLAESAAGH
jgi:hypothetical protein